MGCELKTVTFPDGIDPDEFFTALAHRRRRYLLSLLCSQDYPLSLTTVADHIATRERGLQQAGSSADGTKQVRVSLLHHHIPHLEDAGLVEYDQAAETIDLSATATDCMPLLAMLTEDNPGR